MYRVLVDSCFFLDYATEHDFGFAFCVFLFLDPQWGGPVNSCFIYLFIYLLTFFSRQYENRKSNILIKIDSAPLRHIFPKNFIEFFKLCRR